MPLCRSTPDLPDIIWQLPPLTGCSPMALPQGGPSAGMSVWLWLCGDVCVCVFVFERGIIKHPSKLRNVHFKLRVLKDEGVNLCGYPN